MSADKTDFSLLIDQLAAELGCSKRTAARKLREKATQSERIHLHAIQMAAHVDWGNRTDIAPSIRELAARIEGEGAHGVSSKDRNSLINGLPLSLQVARTK